MTLELEEHDDEWTICEKRFEKVESIK